jgi:lipoyl(octanoyl) transferase
MIATCRDLGVETARVPGRSGVWLRADERGPERKVGAIGLRVSRGVTMHGIALNCDVDLGWYDRFVPCGIADAGVTTLSQELGRDVTVAEVLPVLQRHLTEVLAWAPYAATADYEPRPEPGRGPRVEVLSV